MKYLKVHSNWFVEFVSRVPATNPHGSTLRICQR
jgi:hypothetical protein